MKTYTQDGPRPIPRHAQPYFFMPPGESAAFYGETTDQGYVHAWKISVNAGSSGKIGLRGGYDGSGPLTLTSNNPGVISFDEPPMTDSSGDRFIRIVGNRADYTMLDARNSGGVVCTIQVEVLPQLYTPNIPEWRLYQMSWEYYNKVTHCNDDGHGHLTCEMSEAAYCSRWRLRQDEFRNLLGIFKVSGLNRDYWDKVPQPMTSVQTNDFLVIGEGGVITLDSDYGRVVLGNRLRSIQPKSGIGSIAGAIARIFSSDPNIIGAIEATGDLIEIGASGFAVARMNHEALKPQVYPTATIAQRKVVGDLFRDQVAEAVQKMHEGTGYTVETEVQFRTEQGDRFGDVVLRDPSGKIVCVLECKTGKGTSIPKQVRKDNELYVEGNIRTIKVTPDFLFLPE